MAACALYSVEKPLARAFRFRQISAVFKLASLTAIANALNALNVLIVAACLWPSGHHGFLVVWVCSIAATVGYSLRARPRFGRRATATGASSQTVAKAAAHAAALSTLWGLMPLALMSTADPGQQLLMAIVITGMICAGGFALSTLPWAASAYVLMLGAALTASLSRAAIAWRICPRF